MYEGSTQTESLSWCDKYGKLMTKLFDNVLSDHVILYNKENGNEKIVNLIVH